MFGQWKGPGRTVRVPMAVVAALAGVQLCGCVNMDSIDRSVDRLVKTRSEALGGGAVAPTPRPLSVYESGPSGSARAVVTEERPPSQNPGAESLPYSEADTDPKAVLARLDSYSALPASVRALDLEGAFRSAQATGREYRSAEEEYLLAAIRLLVEQHRWGPRLFDDIRANVDGTGDNATYQSALRVINELRATQRLPYGGEVEARLITQATQQLTGVAGEQYEQASQLVLGANVPLLRGAGTVAREDIIQAERDLVYAARGFEDFRRRHLVDIARDYFALVAQQSFISNQEQRLDSVIKLQERTTALVQAGRESAFRARNVEQNVLTSRNSLISARENYLLALDRFKVRLGMAVDEAIRIEPVSLELPDPDIGVARAAELALMYRLDYQNARDQNDDARRQVDNARNDLLPDLNLTAQTTLNTDKDRNRGKFDFDLKDTDYAAGVLLSLPLDRRIERLNLRSSMIQLQRRVRETDELRDTIILSSRRAVREIDRARNALLLLSKAVEINQLRNEELDLRSDEVEPQEKLDAENELLQSRNDYQDALRDLRIAILEYLLQTGQLRVGSDGTFKALEGMVVRMVDQGDTPEAVVQTAGEVPPATPVETGQADPAPAEAPAVAPEAPQAKPE
ncbi:MAG: TolC family protein [Planctomycetes bacterium]|nr:TolC family protein [Planctomycetota bacterium]